MGKEEECSMPLAQLLLSVLEQVGEYGLQREVLEWTLRELKVTKEALGQAIWTARCEWDV